MLTFGPKVASADESWIQRHPNVVFFSVCLISGVLMGFVWHSIVTLPSYTVGDDMTAVIREYGLSRFFAADAWFSALGFAAGIGIGFLCWHLYKSFGWAVVGLSVFGGLLTAVICWKMGSSLGPSDFATRIATAQPGDQVMIDFELHTYVSLLVWPFGAVLPALAYSAFSSPDELNQEDS